jgi:PAS domain S-box-containing protein
MERTAAQHVAPGPASPEPGPADARVTIDPVARAEPDRPDPSAGRGARATTAIALDATPDTVALYDAVVDARGQLVDVEVTFVNETGRRRWLAGRPLDQVVGTRLVRDWPAVGSLVFDIYADVFRTGRPHRATQAFATPDGERLIDVSVNAFPGGLVHIGRDVTDDRQAVAALRATDERLRRTIEGMNAILGYQDRDGAPIINSAQTAQILGYPPEALRTHEAWNALVHPDDLPACVEAWNTPSSGWELTYRMRRADGTWIWVSDRGRRLPDGEPGIRSLGVVVDVTAQRAAADALRASEESLRRVIDGVDAIISVQDRSGGPATLSQQVVRVLGYRPEELAEYDAWKRIVHPDDLPRCLVAWHAPEDAWDIEYRARRSDGTWVWLADRGRRIDQGDGRGTGVFAVITDITERKRAEVDLDEANASLARLAGAIEQTSESVVMTDVEGRVTYVNPAFERVTGYRRDEVLGGNPRILKSGVHEAAFYEAMWSTLASGATWHGELVNLTKDGRRIREDASISPVRDESGRTTGYVAVKRDITAERELEDRLLHSQRLEAVGQLAGGVAHDFNNLLAVMGGYGDLVAAGLEPGSPARADMDEVLRAIERATALVRQLLAFSRRQVLTPRVVDPSAVIAGILPMLSQLLGEHITIATLHDPKAGCVLVDPGQLEQVIVNLAVNARDAMPDGGRLTISTSKVGAGRIPGDGEAATTRECTRISVSDNGSGIDPATLEHIFEPFFTTKEAGRGSGLGLATVYGIVDQSGGTITVASTPGEGTTFTVDLPVVDPGLGQAPGSAAVAPDPAADPAGPRLHVLLVEDDPAVRALGRRMLESLGYRVTDASQAYSALDVLVAGSDPVDLLITDVRMPGMQGPELARQATALLPDLPVLFATALSDEVSLTGLDGGAFHLIEKPFSVVGLADGIAAVLATGSS